MRPIFFFSISLYPQDCKTTLHQTWVCQLCIQLANASWWLCWIWSTGQTLNFIGELIAVRDVASGVQRVTVHPRGLAPPPLPRPLTRQSFHCKFSRYLHEGLLWPTELYRSVRPIIYNYQDHLPGPPWSRIGSQINSQWVPLETMGPHMMGPICLIYLFQKILVTSMVEMFLKLLLTPFGIYLTEC